MSSPLSAYQFNQTVTPLIESVGLPLLKNFGITHFGHIKVNNDGLMLRLANYEPWNKIYFQEEFYNDDKLYNMSWLPLHSKRRQILIGQPNTLHQQILFENGLWNFLLIYERTENEGTFTFFGTTPENAGIIDYYLNNSEAFDHFALYFKEKTFPYLEMKKDRCIQLKNSPFEFPKNEDNVLENFYKQTEISKFHLGESFGNLILSKREAQCLYYLLRGQSAKEIAKTLHLSPRTVESFLDIIKRKTGVHCKAKLVEKLYNAIPVCIA
ncbi:MAG: LuxR C-terminal-related transcriptional regulator [Alphaproteobacteria bacterium]|nr:LuxR C-terminal-related transcriptional regulator [Alphaproteobacteria bacterium]